MSYGLESSDNELALLTVKKVRMYPDKNFLSVGNREIPFAELSDSLLVNPQKFMKLFTDRLNAYEEYADKRGLCQITIVLTAKDNNLSKKEIVDDLNKDLERLRQRVAWKKIRKDLKLYISTIEPHATGRPHVNVVFWLPQENVEKFIEDLLSKFKYPQIYIMSSFIPSNFNCKERVNKKGKTELVCTRDDLEGFIVKTDISMLKYVTKNIRKIAKQLEQNKYEVSELLTWYLVNNMRFFNMSQNIGPVWAYKKVKNIFSLLNFTELWECGDIQAWKQNKSLDKITQGNVLLWEKSEKLSYSSAYKGNIVKKNIISPYNIDIENPKTEILWHGSLKTIVQQNGIQKFEIILSESGKNLNCGSYEHANVTDLENSNTKKLENSIEIIQNVQFIMQQSIDKVLEEQKKVLKEIQEKNKKIDLVSDIKYVGTKELDRIFDIKIRTQKNLRGRVENPLPFHQDVENGKISYYVPDIEEWKYKQKIR